ncbi:hypothetical protein E2L08_12515 [Palleronia sediminis]|uniref:Uncharacterized protein n=1 Tax=Palleronia sediminis TaxID=2547833 RepID=A0A4R6AA35_9RHOB|nr:hypothetical protein [Palleronia sediminis]TDL78116.1 hypothetical protein E2L08_12515 [Palleronia sediminis]
MLTPEERACLTWAFQITHDALGQLVYVHDDGRIDAFGEVFRLDSESLHHHWIALLAASAEGYLAGVKPGQLRSDLLAAGVREEAANFVHDHLVDVSEVEWDALTNSVQQYRELMADKAHRSTQVGGLI